MALATQSKVCSSCGQTKDFNCFHKDSSTYDGMRSRCKSCVKEYDDSRKEERNRRAREKYADNPQEKIAKTRQYHLDHPEWSKERLRAHHVANREERAERARERGKDPEVRAKRREATRRSEQRRRAVKAKSHADLISADDYQLRLDEFGGCCYICEQKVGADLHWDHHRPLARGGDHVIDNLYPTCASCNVRKSACWPFTDERRQEIKDEVLALKKQLVESVGQEVV